MLLYSNLSFITKGNKFSHKNCPLREQEADLYTTLRRTKIHAVLSGDDLKN